jgi:cytochrome c oxidase cbb3-type subunit 3
MSYFKQIARSALLCGLIGVFLNAQEPQTPGAAPAKGARKPATPSLPPEVANLLGLPPAQDPGAVDRGNRDFVANCAFCHGSSATGGEGGPDLVRSVLVLHDEKGDLIGPVILNGRKTMPKFPFSQAQITDIAAFLHHQAQSKANRMSYEIQNVVTGDPKAGEAYFASKCNSCHSATGDLAKIATKYDPVALQSRFLFPKTFTWPGMPQVGPKPKPVLAKVTLASGQSFSGTLKHIDDFSVALYDSDGYYHSWLRESNPGLMVELHNPLAGHMELIQQYTDADMHNVLAYLETLK